MIQFEDFEEFDPTQAPHCIACEAMLTDAVDGTLGEIDRAWFEQHIGSCMRCAERMEQAQRGSAWLGMLKSSRPEPAGDLVARIMAQTSGQTGGQTSGQISGQTSTAALTPHTLPTPSTPFLTPIGTMHLPAGNVVPLAARQPARRFWIEPRLAMTAAMAFFSLALTLNLTGVRLDQLHASDLKPGNLQRSYFQASTKAVQFYDNLRVVHVMESRVEDLKQANEDREQRFAAPEPKHEEQPEQKKQEKKSEPGAGTSRWESPLAGPRLLMADDRTSGFWREARLSIPTSTGPTSTSRSSAQAMQAAGGRL